METSVPLFHGVMVEKLEIERVPDGWHMRRFACSLSEWVAILEWSVKNHFDLVVEEEYKNEDEPAFHFWTEGYRRTVIGRIRKAVGYEASGNIRKAVTVVVNAFLDEEALIHYRLTFGD